MTIALKNQSGIDGSQAFWNVPPSQYSFGLNTEGGANHLVVVMVNSMNTDGDPSSIQLFNGNTYQEMKRYKHWGPNYGGSYGYTSIWYMMSTWGGANWVRVNNVARYSSMCAMEFSGVDAANPFETVVAVQRYNLNAYSSLTYRTYHDNICVVAYNGLNNPAPPYFDWTADCNYIGDNAGGGNSIAGHQIVAAKGEITSVAGATYQGVPFYGSGIHLMFGLNPTGYTRTTAYAIITAGSTFSVDSLGMQIAVDAIGGGGGAASNYLGGGGGGEHRASTVPYIPGTVVPISVGGGGAGVLLGPGGDGGDTTWDTGVVVAKGGKGAGNNRGQGGTGGTGDVGHAGGHGGYQDGYEPGGGGAGGPNGIGANGGYADGSGNPAGGGGADGGGPGGNAPTGDGGINRLGSGGGSHGTDGTNPTWIATDGAAGANGAGGGAGGNQPGNSDWHAGGNGGKGGDGTEWGTAGAGGGGGAGGHGSSGDHPWGTGGNGGLYGGGGAAGAGGPGGQSYNGPSGSGAQGVLVITYEPIPPNNYTATVADTIVFAETRSLSIAVLIQEVLSFLGSIGRCVGINKIFKTKKFDVMVSKTVTKNVVNRDDKNDLKVEK